MNKCPLPQVATKADLLELRHTLTLRFIVIVGAVNAALFALLRLL